MPEPKPQQRSRVIVLGILLVMLAGVLVYTWRPAASPPAGPSNQTRDQRKPVATTATGPSDLTVKLEELKAAPPEPGEKNRNPFRFYVPPPPPPPPGPVTPPPPPVKVLQPGDQGYMPPPPPPIPLKFIGIMEQGKKKVAIFTDGRGVPLYASEGELVLGQYRLVKIQVESVIMEYSDGKGRQTIPMRGQ
jgi:hypothetical protein